MAVPAPDYIRVESNRHDTIWLGPTGAATGIQNIGAPTADEINNTGGTSAVINASPSISWNDLDFGVQDSDTENDPSLADAANYEDFGQENYGGSMSLYYPNEYDDNTNNHSLVYDLTDEPRTKLDVVERIDGAKTTSTPAVDGDFAHVFRTLTDGESQAWDGAESLRRTVTHLSQGALAICTVVGLTTLVAVPPTATPYAAGTKARLRVTAEDRDITNSCDFRSSDGSVVAIYPGGFYEITGASAATSTITITHRASGITQTVAVTVS